MNTGTIVTPNTKGQIVIPQKIREALGITQNTPLQINQVGQAVILHPIDFADAAIAATAIHNHCELATLNPKDFTGIPNLSLHQPLK